MHCGICDMEDKLIQWTTFVYAHNTLECRRELWKDIEQISANLTGPWMVIGDLNNVLKMADQVGGNQVMVSEYADLEEMMVVANLVEKETEGVISLGRINKINVFSIRELIGRCVILNGF